MSKHNGCSGNVSETNLVLEAKRIVVWAGELTQPGEPVGSISQQNRRASEHLRLPIGVIKRARYKRSGPEIYPSIEKARDELVERLARSPWGQIGGQRGYTFAPVIPFEPRPHPEPMQTSAPWTSRARRCG